MHFKKNPQIVYASLDSEICLFNPERGEYLNLNSTASLIWNLIDESSTFDGIANKLKELFDMKDANYIEELKDFIEESKKHNILIVKEEN